MNALARNSGTRTANEFRRRLRANGITLEQWCREHGIKRTAASDILRGQTKGYFGEAHRAAVAMGLKPDPKEATP